MNPVVHVLTLVFAMSGAPVEPPVSIDLGRYDTAVECEMQARSVKVRHRGARLKCVRAPMTPEERQAWALLVGGAP